MDTNKLIALLPEMAVFVVVIEEGSFSKAAEKLGVAPSSVSRSISKLENALCQKLLERTTRNMRLTIAGEEVHGLCMDMLKSARLATDAAFSSQSEVAGEIRIAAPRALASQVLSPLILDFLQEYPNVSVHFVVEDHFIDPIGHEVDMVIHITDKPVEGLVAKELGTNRLLICASTDYLEKFGYPGSPEELTAHQCIRLGESPADRKWVFGQQDIIRSVNIDGRLAVNHTEIRKDAVLRGMGISIFPEFSIDTLIQSGDVEALFPEWEVKGSYQGKIVAQYPQSRFIPRQFKMLVEYLHSRLSETAVSSD
ncbi:LysR family transcriptional regulator [Vibrio sp. STUT-A11]|uniref:LysR family transcriptional regulator n=1 Tax=unclassified Vibrio TaxID=2614977 RepID=UPI0022329772|nr:LysR family transcriptional regulator [Vibrio sp. STUT-A11]BDR15915.1 LysR family transcriptional regulator [Vibrio sp. STUT-A11]